MDLATALLAATEAEPSKVAFYVAGGGLAAWAVLVSLLGIKRPDFAAEANVSRAVIAITVVLVLITLGSVIATN